MPYVPLSEKVKRRLAELDGTTPQATSQTTQQGQTPSSTIGAKEMSDLRAFGQRPVVKQVDYGYTPERIREMVQPKPKPKHAPFGVTSQQIIKQLRAMKKR